MQKYYRVGETLKIGGKDVVVKESDRCDKCIIKHCDNFACMKNERKDGKDVIFEEIK